MGVYDQIKKAFQDLVAPEIRALQGDIKGLHVEIKRLDDKIESGLKSLDTKIDTGLKRLDDKIDSVHREVESSRREAAARFDSVVTEIRRLDGRIDALDRDLKTAIEIRERLAVIESRLASH